MTELLRDIGYVAAKSLAAAVALFLLARLMGKKQIAQLSFFDYTIGISIGSIAAAVSVDRHIPLHDGITSMLIWAVIPLLFSFLSLHSMTARSWLDGMPTVLIQDGKVLEKNLRKSRYTVNDLLEALRLKGVFSVSEVRFAILETNGEISVLKKTMAGQPQAPAGPAQQENRLETCVVIDGKPIREGMRQMRMDKARLETELHGQNISAVDEVLLATCDENGALHVDRKRSDPPAPRTFQ